jgi:hypothetical protein
MAKGKVKVKDYEKLDDVSIKHVIQLLSRPKDPITKKEACEILNISYNTSRLNKIIQDFKDRQEYSEKRIKENKGKPFSDYDKKSVIIEYLRGASITGIAKLMFRSTASIKTLLKHSSVPLKEDYRGLIPEENWKEIYEKGELAWSAKYECVVEIMSSPIKDSIHGNVYPIWVFGKYNERAYQPWYELGALPVVKELEITGNDIKLTDSIRLDYR